MADARFRATGVAQSPTRTTIKTRHFTFEIDEPVDEGGQDAGPNPVEFLLASLLGCLTVVVQLVAAERGIKVENLTLDAHGDLNPARFLGQPTDDRAGYKAIEVKTHFDTDADEAAVAELLAECERRCPVADTLTGGTTVTLKHA